MKKEKVYIAAQGIICSEDSNSVCTNANENRNFVHQKINNIFFFWTGPKPTTVSDFWSMVLQENIDQIVMLTNLKEGTKVNYILV